MFESDPQLARSSERQGYSWRDGEPKVGTRVQLATTGSVGTVRFHGKIEGKTDEVWLGVELDEARGKNDGSVEGVQYFSCSPNHGIFAKPSGFSPARRKKSRRSTSSSTSSIKAAAKDFFRRMFVSGIEEHDVECLRRMLPDAAKWGLDAGDIRAAEHIIEFEAEMTQTRDGVDESPLNTLNKMLRQTLDAVQDLQQHVASQVCDLAQQIHDDIRTQFKTQEIQLAQKIRDEMDTVFKAYAGHVGDRPLQEPKTRSQPVRLFLDVPSCENSSLPGTADPGPPPLQESYPDTSKLGQLPLSSVGTLSQDAEGLRDQDTSAPERSLYASRRSVKAARNSLAPTTSLGRLVSGSDREAQGNTLSIQINDAITERASPRLRLPDLRPDKFTIPDLDQFSVRDPRQHGAKEVPIIAFYFPGHAEPWDTLCGSCFLGNFFELDEHISIHPKGRDKQHHMFTNTEAAFQALKFWHVADQFADKSGHDAFTLKKKLAGQEDWTYSGYGSNWTAMEHVLRSKFNKKSTSAKYLLRTKDAFLLEHNSVSGRDSTWSDNSKGDGTNWLGLQLMKIRDELSDKPSWTTYLKQHIDLESGRPSGNSGWQDLVQEACDVVKQKFGGRGGGGRGGGGPGAMCGCGRPTWNGQWNETCSRSCPGPRISGPLAAVGGAAVCGCGNPTWNGRWNETCKRSCPGPRLPGPSAASSYWSASAAPSDMSGAGGGGGGRRPICGCGKPTWNGQWNETCSRSCPGPRIQP